MKQVSLFVLAVSVLISANAFGFGNHTVRQQWHGQWQGQAWPNQQFRGQNWGGYNYGYRWNPPVRRIYPQYPQYPIVTPAPLPLPPPVEQAYVYPNQIFPSQVFVNQACDQYAYPPPVVNTIPEQSFYCPSTYGACDQAAVLPYAGAQARPVILNAPIYGVCSIRPTYNPGIFVLLLNGQQNLATGTAQNVNFRYRQYRAMGTCR